MDQLKYLSNFFKNLVYYFYKYKTKIKLIYIKYIYKYIQIYLLYNFLIIFLFNIYLYIIQFYKDINNVKEWGERVKKERTEYYLRKARQYHYDFHWEDYEPSDAMKQKKTKPIDWYIGLVAYSILLAQDYWVMYWLYTTYDYMYLRKNWIYWVKNDILIFLKLVGVVCSIVIFIYLFTLFLTFVIEPFILWFKNFIKKNEIISIFSIFSRIYKLFKYIFLSLPRWIHFYPNYLLAKFKYFIKYFYKNIILVIRFFVGAIILIIQIILILFYLLLLFIFRACLWYFIKDVLILNIGTKLLNIFGPIFLPYINPFINLLVYIYKLINSICWPFFYIFKKFLFKFIYIIFLNIRYIFNLFISFLFILSNIKDYLNYLLIKLDIINFTWLNILFLKFNIIKNKYYEGTKVQKIYNSLKKKKRICSIYIKDKDILLYISNYIIYFKGKYGFKYYFLNILKKRSKTQINFYYILKTFSLIIKFILLKIINYIQILFYKYIISLLLFIKLKLLLYFKNFFNFFFKFNTIYNNTKFKYIYIICFYLDIIDNLLGIRSLPIAIIIFKKIKLIINSLITYIKFLLNKPILNNEKSIKNIFLRSPYYLFSFIKYIFKGSYNIIQIQIQSLYNRYQVYFLKRRSNYNYMLNLLYINAILVPLPISVLTWNLLYNEEIIDIEYKFAVLTSKFIFLFFHLILSWIVLFMDIHIESGKNEDFKLNFNNFRNSFMVHIFNFTIITIFFSLIVFFYQHCWIGIDGEGFIKNMNYELLDPYKIYGDINNSNCQICAALFTIAKMSIGVYFFIYWLFFKSLAEHRLNIFRFFWLFRELKYKTLYLYANGNTIYEFETFYEEYRLRMVLRVIGLVIGVLLLFILAYLFCNIIVYKIFIIRN